MNRNQTEAHPKSVTADNTSSLSARVFEELEDGILSGQNPSGENLIEQAVLGDGGFPYPGTGSYPHA